MSAVLKVASASLAGLDPRATPDMWLRRAYESSRRRTGPLDQIEDRMLDYLEGQIASATERQAAKAQVQAFRREVQAFRHAGIPDGVTEAARERIQREGGISHEHAQELGYASLADFLSYTPEADQADAN